MEVLREQGGQEDMKKAVTGGWRELHSGGLHNLHCLPNIARMRWARHVARMETMQSAYKIVDEKREGKRPLRRLWRRWEDLKEIVLGDVDWIHLAQDRDRWRRAVNIKMNVPIGSWLLKGSDQQLFCVLTFGSHKRPSTTEHAYQQISALTL
jgi:hypothetical protein